MVDEALDRRFASGTGRSAGGPSSSCIPRTQRCSRSCGSRRGRDRGDARRREPIALRASRRRSTFRAYEGAMPTEMFGRTPFAPVTGELPYFLTLGAAQLLLVQTTRPKVVEPVVRPPRPPSACRDPRQFPMTSFDGSSRDSSRLRSPLDCGKVVGSRASRVASSRCPSCDPDRLGTAPPLRQAASRVDRVSARRRRDYCYRLGSRRARHRRIGEEHPDAVIAERVARRRRHRTARRRARRPFDRNRAPRDWAARGPRAGAAGAPREVDSASGRRGALKARSRHRPLCGEQATRR